MIGFVAGYILDSCGTTMNILDDTPFIGYQYQHSDIILTGVEDPHISRRGVTRPSDTTSHYYTMGGIRRPDGVSANPSTRTTANGGFYLEYEFDSYRAMSDFELETFVRFRVFNESAMLSASGRDITGWRPTHNREYETRAMVIPNCPNITEYIQAYTAHYNAFGILGDAVTNFATERSVILSTAKTAWERISMISNPEERYLMVSIVIVRV